jgi:hypothetical protein
LFDVFNIEQYKTNGISVTAGATGAIVEFAARPAALSIWIEAEAKDRDEIVQAHRETMAMLARRLGPRIEGQWNVWLVNCTAPAVTARGFAPIAAAEIEPSLQDRVNGMVRELELAGIDSSELDEMVIDTSTNDACIEANQVPENDDNFDEMMDDAEGDASIVNNNGLGAQVCFLFTGVTPSEAEEAIISSVLDGAKLEWLEVRRQFNAALL